MDFRCDKNSYYGLIMVKAGKLRHRIKFQRQVESQDSTSGAVIVDWVDVATVWAEIAPLSGKEFIASQTEFSQITTRMTIRYRVNIVAKMRALHVVGGINRYYDIQAILADKESGLEYMTLLCSEGVLYETGEITEGVPVNVEIPKISGSPSQGATIQSDNGRWTNVPTSFTYQWFLNDVPITGASGTVQSGYILQETGDKILTEDSMWYLLIETAIIIDVVVPNSVGSELKIGVVANNSFGDSEIAYSLPVTIVA